MFRVTRDWIMAHRSESGGWTKLQLKVIQVSWPPTRGWMDKACALTISAQAKLAFEVARNNSPVKVKKRKRQTKFVEHVEPKPLPPIGSRAWILSQAFYKSFEWKEVRYKALKLYGAACQCCNASKGKTMHVDHIKPRSKYPELALDLNNLQILCEDCNIGKSSWDETDWRDSPELPEILPDGAIEHLKSMN
jgi:5-methylcytosine-specific restriction endonuclease McrA